MHPDPPPIIAQTYGVLRCVLRSSNLKGVTPQAPALASFLREITTVERVFEGFKMYTSKTKDLIRPERTWGRIIRSFPSNYF